MFRDAVLSTNLAIILRQGLVRTLPCTSDYANFAHQGLIDP